MPTNSAECSCQQNASVPGTYERALEHILVPSQQMYRDWAENSACWTVHSSTKVLIHDPASEARLREASSTHTGPSVITTARPQTQTEGADLGRFGGGAVSINALCALPNCNPELTKNTFDLPLYWTLDKYVEIEHHSISVLSGFGGPCWLRPEIQFHWPARENRRKLHLSASPTRTEPARRNVHQWIRNNWDMEVKGNCQPSAPCDIHKSFGDIVGKWAMYQ